MLFLCHQKHLNITEAESGLDYAMAMWNRRAAAALQTEVHIGAL